MPCEICGNEAAHLYSAGEFESLCAPCYEARFRRCRRCSQVFHLEDLTPVGGGVFLCGECLDIERPACVSCGERFDRDDIIEAEGGEPFCQRCFSEIEGAGFCDRCSTATVELLIRNGEELCHACAEAMEAELPIHRYSYRPNLVFHKIKNEKPMYYMGVELEVEGDISASGELVDEYSRDESLFYLKEDGSLRDGFEIVTHPCSFKYLTTRFPWKALCAFLTRRDCTSHKSGRCGLHIHISRTAFDSPLHLFKFASCFYLRADLREFLVRFSRRKTFQYCSVSSEAARGLPRKCRDRAEAESRYEAVNFQNRSTIEVRLWRGTLNSKSVKACIECTDALIHYSRETGLKSLGLDSFIEWLNAQPGYRNLKAYIQDRRLLS